MTAPVVLTLALSNPWAYQALACFDREKRQCFIVDEGFVDQIDVTLKKLERQYSEGATELSASFSQSNNTLIYTFDKFSQSWNKG